MNDNEIKTTVSGQTWIRAKAPPHKFHKGVADYPAPADMWHILRETEDGISRSMCYVSIEADKLQTWEGDDIFTHAPFLVCDQCATALLIEQREAQVGE